jgi:hypothetical protein
MLRYVTQENNAYSGISMMLKIFKMIKFQNIKSLGIEKCAPPKRTFSGTFAAN